MADNGNKRLTVLLAEDHKYNLLALKSMLEKLGIYVITAENGREAVDIFTNTLDIDLVLMDIKMPVMDGYKAMQEIKRLRPGMKVIAETAYALSGDDRKMLDAGFDDYLAKPITQEKLVSILNRNI